jgi:conjugative transfer signal peptidase TraF
MLAGAVLLWSAVEIAVSAGLRINHTASLPIGLWRVSPLRAPLWRGAIVSFCAPQNASVLEAYARGYLGTGRCPGGLEPMLKQVQAIAGDRVMLTTVGVSVNGVLQPNSQPLRVDGTGRPVISMPFGAMVVPPGAFWAGSSENARSFDSRYFGPVATDDILGLAIPLMRWPTS